MEEIYFKDNLNKLYNGITKLHDAVASTLGPNGKTVIISNQYGEPYITKDGVSVAKSISFKDPVENIGAQLIKQVAEKTVKEAGDGTTTSIVLANALIQNLKEFDYVEVVKQLDIIIPKVIEELKKNSKPLKREDVKYVATISANNDSNIGDLIQEAYNFSDIIKVEESNSTNDSLILVDGMQLNSTSFSKHFLTSTKGECIFDNPFVLLLDGKLKNLKNIENILNNTYQNEQSLLIITEHVDETTLKFLESNVLNKGLKLCVIKSPGFAQHRKDLMNDISIFTNAKPVRETKEVELSDLGKLESCTISAKNSILVKKESIDVSKHLKYLESIKENDLEEHDLDLLNIRINNLKGKVSIIKVGGNSELEMKERKDRIDDAVLAVGCALEEGIVEGGGVALMKTVATNKEEYTDIETNIYVSLNAPYFKIFENGSSWNAKKNMFNENIIDPLKVTRVALENAVSVAKVILSTNTVVLNQYQWT